MIFHPFSFISYWLGLFSNSIKSFKFSVKDELRSKFQRSSSTILNIMIGSKWHRILLNDTFFRSPLNYWIYFIRTFKISPHSTHARIHPRVTKFIVIFTFKTTFFILLSWLGFIPRLRLFFCTSNLWKTDKKDKISCKTRQNWNLFSSLLDSES